MRNLRQAFMRGVKGMVVGAGITSAIFVLVICLLLGSGLVLVAIYDPKHFVDDLERSAMALFLPFLTCMLVGSVAGFAARLPRKGVGMLRAIAVVATCVVLPGVFTVSQVGIPHPTSRYEIPSFVLMTSGAIVGGIIVLVYGIIATKRSKADDGPTPTASPSTHGEGHE